MDRNPTQLMDKKGVAAMLKISERQVDIMRERGEFPVYKIGGSVRFKQVDIEAYLEGRKEVVGVRHAA